jgi:hypothetical protein
MPVKFRIPEIVLGVLLTVAVFAAGYIAASPVPPPNQQIEAAGHPQATNEGADHAAEKQIAYYTKWLAWFTAALVAVSGIQGYFLLRADKTARIAANAADLSAKAAVGIQLPIIRLFASKFVISDKPDALGGTIVPNPIDYKTEYARPYSMTFKNIGRSAAYPTEFGFGWTHTELPAEPVYANAFSCDPGQIIAEDGDFTPTESIVVHLTDEIRAAIKAGKILRVFAYIKYTDFLESPHETRYCWRLNGRNGLVREHEAPAAYTRKT